MTPSDGDIQLLLATLDQAYGGPAWHGPSLRGALRPVKASVAAWRPAPGRNTIWELAVHCAYWKYTVRRRILGLKKGSFPLAGSNFFARPEGEPTETAWKADLALLDASHAELRESVATLDPQRLRELTRTWTIRDAIAGVALHDTYHGGQIGLLRKLYPGAG